jgi:hypothetical protein
VRNVVRNMKTWREVYPPQNAFEAAEKNGKTGELAKELADLFNR